MIRTFRCFLIAGFISCLNFPLPAQALKIEITQGQVEAIPIALPEFIGSGPGTDNEITKVITADLEASGLFNPLNPAAFVKNSDPAVAIATPRFADWRILKAQFLVVGQVVRTGGTLTAHFRLFDVMSGQEQLALSFSAEPSKWRKVAHMIADAIYERITAEKGYFNTRISFIDESGPRGKRRVRRLGIMDWDGENVSYLTDGRFLVLTPRMSPNNQEIAYLSYAERVPHVFLYNLATKSSKNLGKFEGMTFAPRFSPDGNRIVMSLEKGGNSAIYCMDISSRTLTPLTQHSVIDTSPCFSPDGKQIVFTSDRDGGIGGEKIFMMDSNGNNVRRISFGNGKYSQPAWSPRGDLIAFTKMVGGVFYIGVMAPDGTGERLITDGFLVEAACWAPNGRVLLFTKETKSKGKVTTRLYSIDITGRNLREVKTPREASDGSWSHLPVAAANKTAH